MPRKYEAVYIFDSTLEDAAINEKLARFHGLLGTKRAARSQPLGPAPARLLRSVPARTATTSSPRFADRAHRPARVRARAQARRRRHPLPHHAARARSRCSAACPRKSSLRRQRAVTTMTTTRINHNEKTTEELPVLREAASAGSTTRTIARSAASSPTRGRFFPSRLSGTCARHQRQLSTAIKRARYLALIPYIKRPPGVA